MRLTDCQACQKVRDVAAGREGQPRARRAAWASVAPGATSTSRRPFPWAQAASASSTRQTTSERAPGGCGAAAADDGGGRAAHARSPAGGQRRRRRPRAGIPSGRGGTWRPRSPGSGVPACRWEFICAARPTPSKRPSSRLFRPDRWRLARTTSTMTSTTTGSSATPRNRTCPVRWRHPRESSAFPRHARPVIRRDDNSICATAPARKARA